jgi:hypothetical protein
VPAGEAEEEVGEAAVVLLALEALDSLEFWVAAVFLSAVVSFFFSTCSAEVAADVFWGEGAAPESRGIFAPDFMDSFSRADRISCPSIAAMISEVPLSAAVMRRSNVSFASCRNGIMM